MLLDTGASISLMPAWQAKALKVPVTPRTDIVICEADGRKLAVNGTGEVWVQDPCATYWKKVKVVVTRDGSWTLISPKDQKRLLLLQKNYPTFWKLAVTADLTPETLKDVEPPLTPEYLALNQTLTQSVRTQETLSNQCQWVPEQAL